MCWMASRKSTTGSRNKSISLITCIRELMKTYTDWSRSPGAISTIHPEWKGKSRTSKIWYVEIILSALFDLQFSVDTSASSSTSLPSRTRSRSANTPRCYNGTSSKWPILQIKTSSSPRKWIWPLSRRKKSREKVVSLWNRWAQRWGKALTYSRSWRRWLRKVNINPRKWWISRERQGNTAVRWRLLPLFPWCSSRQLLFAYVQSYQPPPLPFNDLHDWLCTT